VLRITIYKYSLFWYSNATLPHMILPGKRKLLAMKKCKKKVYSRLINRFTVSMQKIRMGKLVAAIGRLFCFAQVNQSTVAIKERFGRFEDVLDPGCHCVPWIIGSRVTGKLTLRLRQMDVRCETKTKVLFKFHFSELSLRTLYAS
jgi:hypothetical protein